jgi:ATP-binding cassette subfamily B protein
MGGPPGMLAEKPKDFGKTMRRLWEHLKPHRAAIIVVSVLSALGTVFAIAGPMLLGMVTTSLVEGLLSGGAVDFARMGRLALVLTGLYAFSAGCGYLQTYLMSKVSNTVSYGMRGSLSQKMHALPLRFFDNVTRGEILSRITNDVDTVGVTLQQSLAQIISSAATVLGVIVMMLMISPLMTLAAMLVMPVSMFVIGQVVKRSQKYFKQQQGYLGELNGQVEEMFSGHSVVQAFNGQEDAVKSFAEVNGRLRKATGSAQFISGLMPPVMNLIGNLGYVMVCMLGGWLAVRGSVSIGGIQAFIQYMRQLTHPMGMMAQISNTLQSTAAAAERVFEFLDEQEEEPDAASSRTCGNVRGDVAFENVMFGYKPEQIVIHGFSADIKAGQKVAIVGPTGAGKTTIVKLLMRFYELGGGDIRIDGQSIRNMPKPELRACFGMVLQDAWLYNATIMENLRYGSFGASDEEVVAAAKAACCDDFIRSLPGGYNMVLSEDAENISQGQRQLFTIARVVLRNPRILILDEATSSVDTRTELLIQDAMDRLKNGRTSFVIAHRLSTIKNADTILVLSEGDIVEQGNHTELLAKGGFYAGLYNSQFG